MTGIVMVTYKDTNFPSHILGCVLTLFANVLSACYKVRTTAQPFPLPKHFHNEAGRFGRRRLCKQNFWRIRKSSKVNAITGTRYFHKSNFIFRQHHFHPEKIYLLRMFALIQPLFPLRKDYFHQNRIHLEIINCMLFKGECSFYFSKIMSFH